jgi:hypothetical protein
MANAADGLPFHAASVQVGITAERPSGKGGSADPDDTTASQLLPTSQATVPAPTEPLVRKMGPISPEEFHALAAFLYENPWTQGKTGYTAHFEKFRQTVIDFYHNSR